MANNNNQYSLLATGDVGAQVFWFDKDHIKVTLSEGAKFTVTLNEATYIAKVKTNGRLVFTADVSTSTTWSVGGETVNLAQYGITLDVSGGAVADEETITIDYGCFVYGVPVTAGAEFGGDTESFDIKETDLGYIGKLSGLSSVNDIPYTVNYTPDKYKRLLEISSNTKINTYMEVLSDGSASVFNGTSGRPTIVAGDVRTITWTIAPMNLVWVDDVFDMYADSKSDMEALGSQYIRTEDGVTSIIIDETTIPQNRQKYYVSENA